MVIVVVLPLPKFLVEQVNIVGDAVLVEELVCPSWPIGNSVFRADG
jgi:hypothetical protein